MCLNESMKLAELGMCPQHPLASPLSLPGRHDAAGSTTAGVRHDLGSRPRPSAPAPAWWWFTCGYPGPSWAGGWPGSRNGATDNGTRLLGWCARPGPDRPGVGPGCAVFWRAAGHRRGGGRASGPVGWVGVGPAGGAVGSGPGTGDDRPGETTGGLVRDMIGVLVWMCARLCGQRGARDRTLEAVTAHALGGAGPAGG